MDEIDENILQIIQNDDKTPYYKIAEKLGIGASTVHFRIKKMLESGIIKSFSAIIDHEKIGYDTIGWIGISVDPRKMDEIAIKMASYDEIQVVTTSTGDHDILVQIITKNEKELWNFINENIKTIDGIEKNFDVSTYLNIYKNTHVINLKPKNTVTHINP